MSRARPDFVDIRLTAAGVKLAGEQGVLRFANARRHFEFHSGVAQEVERSYEWNALLRHERFQGEQLFEVVPDVEQEEGK